MPLPIYELSLSKINEQVAKWNHALPNVDIFYAVKSFPHPDIIKRLHSLNCGFDCASAGEIDIVNSITKYNGRNIIFANTVKCVEHIYHALDHHVNLFTFDSIEELIKIRNCSMDTRLVLRIKVDNIHCASNFGYKFGSDDITTLEIIQHMNEHNIKLYGFSFHVGSGNLDRFVFAKTIEKCAQYSSLLPYPIELLDLGGGFVPNEQFYETALVINDAITQHFPRTRIIAEPGRFISEPSVNVTVQIIGKRLRDNVLCYTINDGVYGAFNRVVSENKMFDIRDIEFKNLTGQPKPSVIFGQTCDSVDAITNVILMPELNIGAKLTFINIGAYSVGLSTEFNGFPKASITVKE
jgi:ornithine decarboxylase